MLYFPMHTVRRERDYGALFREFWPIYEQRPIRDNSGGCQLPQLFGLWCFVRELQPSHVVESGVWKGQTTWLIETAAPAAAILSIDPVPQRRQWTSQQARYSQIDFGYQDLGDFPRDRTLAFFDDHVNPLKRLHQLRSFGLRHAVFEDNCPAGAGDPSIRQMLAGAPAGTARRTLKNDLRSFLRGYVARFDDLAERYCPRMAQSVLASMSAEYEEFPPLARPDVTAWGTPWRDSYPDAWPCIPTVAVEPSQRTEITRTAQGYIAICRVDLA
jgi:hypothetical protein